MAKKKNRPTAKPVPRLGPPANLRPAGAHASGKAYDRQKLKAALDREEADRDASVPPEE